MAWWDWIATPVRNVWSGAAARLGIRQSGLTRLRREVSTCEYEDVHVMWELLTESGQAGRYRVSEAAQRRSRRREESRMWAVPGWGRVGFCSRF